MKPEDRTEEHYANIPVVTADCDLKQLATDTAEDCRAFCVEKHGEAPEIVVSTGQKDYHCKPKPASNGLPTAPDSLIIEGHVHFVLMELLKNAMKATIAHWGPRLPEAPPVQVQVSRRGGEIGLRVSDCGGGIPLQHRASAMRYFYTTEPERQFDPSEGSASRFSGYGFGLPMARLYARLAGGDLTLSVLPGYGTDAHVILGRYGAPEIPAD